MTVEEMNLRTESALLDLVFGPVAERGESAPAGSAYLVGLPEAPGATSLTGTQPSNE